MAFMPASPSKAACTKVDDATGINPVPVGDRKAKKVSRTSGNTSNPTGDRPVFARARADLASAKGTPGRSVNPRASTLSSPSNPLVSAMRIGLVAAYEKRLIPAFNPIGSALAHLPNHG